MDECIQQIQPLLITGNKRQFYFGWKPPDWVGIVETSSASPLLSLIAAEDSWISSCTILLHTLDTHCIYGALCICRYIEHYIHTDRNPMQGPDTNCNATGETKHWSDAPVLTVSSVWSSHTHTDCLHANILQVWARLSSGQADRRKGHHLTAWDGTNWCPVASGK